MSDTDPVEPDVRPPLYDPTGTDVAERIAATARGAAPVVRRRRRRAVVAEEAQWSGPAASSRDPQPAGQVLERVLRKRGWTKQLSVTSLMPRWAEFVGDVNAQHTTPEKYEAGTLTVRAESTTWATALGTMAPMVVKKLNEILGAGVVTKIRVVGPQAPSWKKGLRSVPGRGPRDTYG